MTSKKVIVLVTVVVLLFVGIAGVAQQAPGPQGEKVRLLIVDETKTFSSTMRVGVLAGILKKNELFEVDVKMVEVDSSYVDPLVASKPPAQPYDIILIVPRGIDNGSVDQIWIVTRGFAELSPPATGAIDALEGIINKLFAEVAVPTDVNADLFPGFFSALYVEEGWL
jgi:hypothetical protein